MVLNGSSHLQRPSYADARFYNDCGRSPHALFLCPIDTSFEHGAASQGCTFRQVRRFEKGQHIICMAAGRLG